MSSRESQKKDEEKIAKIHAQAEHKKKLRTVGDALKSATFIPKPGITTEAQIQELVRKIENESAQSLVDELKTIAKKYQI